MTKLVCSFMFFLVINSSSFCQPMNPSQKISKEDYLKKSKSQNTAAWIVFGTGTVLASVGLAIGLKEATDALIGILFLQQPKSSNGGEALFYSGLATMAGSIPLFIASSKNKKRARAVSASFKMENRSTIHQSALVRTSFPSLSLKLNL